jgi:chaperone required for assembly of F1-ATPase
VALDGRVTKTLYKDDLCIPSRALAVAIAEEWDSQDERIDMKTLKLNQIIAKAVRTVHDPTLVSYMRNQIQIILSNDQICHMTDPKIENDYY